MKPEVDPKKVSNNPKVSGLGLMIFFAKEYDYAA
jgi:hypothetical protein|tara:strand:- start:351 stop:452 length:102 start_codon:yes stop_codon:yes gene_type:complete